MPPESWADDEKWKIERSKEAEDTIRSHITTHLLDPQTLAFGLADSPVQQLLGYGSEEGTGVTTLAMWNSRLPENIYALQRHFIGAQSQSDHLSAFTMNISRNHGR